MIESLNSPHIARVKALIGSRGVKERKNAGQFVAEGLQCAREALVAESGPRIETLYLTANGRNKVEEFADLSQFNTVDVSDEVMKHMSETITPQGIIAICTIPGQLRLRELLPSAQSPPHNLIPSHLMDLEDSFICPRCKILVTPELSCVQLMLLGWMLLSPHQEALTCTHRRLYEVPRDPCGIYLFLNPSR